MIVDLYTRTPCRGIAIHDNVDRPPAELLAEVFPGVPLTRDVGKSGTLLAIDLLAIDLLGIDRARQVLGFNPAHSWRDYVKP